MASEARGDPSAKRPCAPEGPQGGELPKNRLLLLRAWSAGSGPFCSPSSGGEATGGSGNSLAEFLQKTARTRTGGKKHKAVTETSESDIGPVVRHMGFAFTSWMRRACRELAASTRDGLLEDEL